MAKAVMEAMGTITQLKKNVGGTQGEDFESKDKEGGTEGGGWGGATIWGQRDTV